MRILITTSRMPFALDEIRKLGKLGHEIIAADTFGTAPGSHSRYVFESVVTPSPRYATRQYIARLREIITTRSVDLVLPQFEEALYVAEHISEIPTRVFTPSFATLRTLHNKVTFTELASKLGLRVPRTTVVKSVAELERAILRSDGFFCKPAYSRGGVELLTDVGPLAGVTHIADCRVTEDNPWVVQEYVAGEDMCSFSVVQHGRVAAHSAYVHPREIDHAGGIVFESVDAKETLLLAETIAAATHYHGQLSLDAKRTKSGLVLLECNPRPTAGVMLMSAEMFAAALFDDAPRTPRLAPPGARKKIASALVRDMFLHWRDIPQDLAHLLSRAPDVYAERGDLAPALYQVLSYSHVLAYRKRQMPEQRTRSDLMSAYFFDVCFNG